MPKLAAKDRKKIDSAEAVGGGFEPMPPGKYVASLSGVEIKTSGAGNAYWNCEFDSIVSLDGEDQTGRQWYILMLPTSDTPPEGYTSKNKKKTAEESWKTYQDLCAGRIKAFFEAFGYSTDSDTEEMIGEKAVLTIGVETIQKGAKAGQLTNRVNDVASMDSVEGAADVASGTDASKAKDDF